MDASRRVTVHEAAIELGVAETTVLGWAQDGTLPAKQEGGTYWFRAEDVAAYANAHPDADPEGDAEKNTHIRSQNPKPR